MYLLLRVDQRLKQNHEDVLLPAHPQELHLSVKDLGLILSQKIIRLSLTQCQNNWVLFFVMVIYFEKKMERLNSGESKTIFGTILCNLNIGLTKSGRKAWQRRKQEKISVLCWFFRNNLVPPSSSRSFRTQSHWSYFTRQCHYSGRFLQVHLSCRMCNQFTFHHQFGIDTGRSKFEQQTDSILSACGSHKQNHKDPNTIDLEAPRLAQYMHKAWKKHQNTVYWFDINLAQKKGLKFYQTRSNAIILHEALPAYCIPKVVGNWRNHLRESMCVTSTSSEGFP